MSSYDVVVLGSGVEALCAAGTLAKARKKVVVLEPGLELGGAERTRELRPGFHVSAGLHGHGGLAPRVVKHLGLEQDGVELLPRDAGVATARADGAPLFLPPEPGAARQLAEGLSPQDGRGFAQLQGFCQRLRPFLGALLTLQPLPFARPKALELIDPAWQAFKLRRLGQKDMLELLRIGPLPLADLLDDYLAFPALQATLAFPALLASPQGPIQPGTSVGLLMWEASQQFGALRRGGLPRGGLGGLSAGLAGCARRLGVGLRTGARPQRLVVEGERVRGVALESGEEISATAVLSALPPQRTLLELLDPQLCGLTVRRRVREYRTQGSAAKVHFALSALPSGRYAAFDQAGRVQLGGETLLELEQAADDVKWGRLSARPPCEAAVLSRFDPELAPEGQAVVSVLCPAVPYRLRDGDWDSAARDELGDNVTRLLDEVWPGFAEQVLAREVLAPPDLERELGLPGGHLLGGELTLDQLFTNRPAPQLGTYRAVLEHPLANLYLTGPWAHPGGYPTGAPGYNAARRLIRDWKVVAAAERAAGRH